MSILSPLMPPLMPQDSPRVEYERRLRLREMEIARLDRLDRWLANARLAVFALGAGLLWPTLATQTWNPAWLLLPIGAFGTLVVVHGRVTRELDRCRLGRAFYQRGLTRISDEWPEPLDDGARFLVDEHPYARDLDLFGGGSLYSLLCTANSLPGRETLAEWLLGPALPAVIAERNEAVQELCGRHDLQEELSVLAAGLSPRLSVAELDAWGTEPRRLEGTRWPVLALILGALNLVAFLAWSFGPLEGRALLLVFGVSAALAMMVRTRVAQVLASIDLPAGELRFLSRLLARLESESFSGSCLLDLQHTAFDPADGQQIRHAIRPSARLEELARLIEWNDSRRNQFFQPLSALLHVGTQLAFAVERWRARHGGVVGDWLRAVGEVEALSALATFSFENADYVFPELVSGRSIFEGVALVHPLLPRESRVANDVSLAAGGETNGPPQLLLISGSNMSGKSTLLRTVGVAAILAYAGAPVAAQRLRLSP